jgi:hypothetical protein
MLNPYNKKAFGMINEKITIYGTAWTAAGCK